MFKSSYLALKLYPRLDELLCQNDFHFAASPGMAHAMLHGCPIPLQRSADCTVRKELLALGKDVGWKCRHSILRSPAHRFMHVRERCITTHPIELGIKRVCSLNNSDFLSWCQVWISCGTRNLFAIAVRSCSTKQIEAAQMNTVSPVFASFGCKY